MGSGITIRQSYDELIKAGREKYSPTPSNNVATTLRVIPNFLWHKYKVTMDHKGDFHKVYIHLSPDLVFQFDVWSNERYRKIDFNFTFPDF